MANQHLMTLVCDVCRKVYDKSQYNDEALRTSAIADGWFCSKPRDDGTSVDVCATCREDAGR